MKALTETADEVMTPSATVRAQLDLARAELPAAKATAERLKSFGLASDLVPAVVEAWYPGQEGGSALADILFGRCSPSGKLPLSVPRSEMERNYLSGDW